MSNFERVKQVPSEGFKSRADARADAQAFKDAGGKIHEGGKRADGRWGWTGEIAVGDSQVSIEGAFGCGRCSLTGRFITYVENGIPKGPGGHCFRCDGKGYHTHVDRKRNWGYDMYGVRVAA